MPSITNCKSIALFVLIFFTTCNAFSQQSRQIILFNEDWKFYKGDAIGADKKSFDDKEWRQVILPHDWSIEGPFDEQWASATAYLPAGIGWYRKTFEVPSTMLSKNIYLYFDGVYKNGEVWINGNYLGKRPNGFIPFQYELTKYLNKSGNNTIAVKVDHTEFADSRWYTGSGIYRNVYLIATNPVSIDLWGVGFSTPIVNKEKAIVKVTVAITNHNNTAAEIIVKTSVIDKKGKQVATGSQTIKTNAGKSANAAIDLSIPNPALWSVAQPQLYTLRTTLIAGGKQIDNDVQQIGLRRFRFDADKGFFLNDEKLKLKGVCIHDDAGALGVAVPEEVWIRRLRILKEAGCNSVRLSHNPHADYLYNLCDSMGLLVMDEAFDEWEIGKNKWIKGWNVGKPGNDGYHEYFKEWADRDVKDMVLRSRNHPSIILWSIGNEIDYPNDPYTHEVLNTGNNPQIYGKGFLPDHPAASRMGEIAKQLVQVVKENDTTRPVTAALAGVVMSNETAFPDALDIVGYNYQEFRYADDHKKYPNRIIYGSENGQGLNAWTAVTDNEFISAQYLWTGIDYLGEARQWPSRSSEAGLIDLAGFKKSEFYFRQSLWTDEPMIYIGTSSIAKNNNNRRGNRNAAPTWNYMQGDSVQVNCFTNCDDAELFLNGQSLGRKSLAETKNKSISWATVYQPGELLVKGYKKGNELSHYTLKTAQEPSSIKVIADKNAFDKNKKQLTHLEISIIDKNGTIVYTAENEITIDIDGPAKLLGLENGSSTSHEDYKSNKHKTLHGKLLAYIQSTQKPGAVKIKISSPGLPAQTLEIK
ncbi:MAG: glycoside hydrolase family 2 TIM barrel-domain containing protein [Chitinophagaceae bacterium]